MPQVSLPALVVFDLAGTTVCDDGQVPAAFSAALAGHGIAVTAEQLEAVRGASKREAVLRFVGDPGRAEQVFAVFRRELARLYRERGVRAIAGAERAFASLGERGVKVVLNTGFDRETTSLLLEALGWGAMPVVCGDDVARGRPAPDLIRRGMEVAGVRDARLVANVGDTALDLEAGHAAGVGWNIAVLTGAHRRERLERAPHTHIVESVAEVAGLWLAR